MKNDDQASSRQTNADNENGFIGDSVEIIGGPSVFVPFPSDEDEEVTSMTTMAPVAQSDDAIQIVPATAEPSVVTQSNTAAQESQPRTGEEMLASIELSLASDISVDPSLVASAIEQLRDEMLSLHEESAEGGGSHDGATNQPRLVPVPSKGTPPPPRTSPPKDGPGGNGAGPEGGTNGAYDVVLPVVVPFATASWVAFRSVRKSEIRHTTAGNVDTTILTELACAALVLGTALAGVSLCRMATVQKAYIGIRLRGLALLHTYALPPVKEFVVPAIQSFIGFARWK